MGVVVCFVGNREQAIIANPLAVFYLLGLNDADQPRLDTAARKGGRMYQQ